MANFRLIYNIVKRIPRGKVCTYGLIGAKLKVTPRMVGRALHKNPDPEDVPCHRVVNGKGKVAQNYAFGGGGQQKKRLVAEGVVFKGAVCVDLKQCLWQPSAQ